MTRRFHLESVEEEGDKIVFTLVFDHLHDFYVEELIDSPVIPEADRMIKIHPSQFGGRMVKGISLTKLVADKIKELGAKS